MSLVLWGSPLRSISWDTLSQLGSQILLCRVYQGISSLEQLPQQTKPFLMSSFCLPVPFSISFPNNIFQQFLSICIYVNMLVKSQYVTSKNLPLTNREKSLRTTTCDSRFLYRPSEQSQRLARVEFCFIHVQYVWDNFHSKQNPFLCLVSAFLHLFLSPFQTISFNNSFQFVYMQICQ